MTEGTDSNPLHRQVDLDDRNSGRLRSAGIGCTDSTIACYLQQCIREIFHEINSRNFDLQAPNSGLAHLAPTFQAEFTSFIWATPSKSSSTTKQTQTQILNLQEAIEFHKLIASKHPDLQSEIVDMTSEVEQNSAIPYAVVYVNYKSTGVHEGILRHVLAKATFTWDGGNWKCVFWSEFDGPGPS